MAGAGSRILGSLSARLANDYLQPCCSVARALSVLLGAGSAGAQVRQLEFHDGKVTLHAAERLGEPILAEWARLGGTQIVNGERVGGAPVTLQLTDVPETQALDIVLRGAAGYIVSARETIDRRRARRSTASMILPTATRRCPRPRRPPPPAAAARSSSSANRTRRRDGDVDEPRGRTAGATAAARIPRERRVAG